LSKVILSLGSNTGDRLANIEKAITLINRHIGIINSKSSLYETEPCGYKSENNFLNMVLEVETNLLPNTILSKCKEIEKTNGRKNISNTYTDRSIDIDILFYENEIIDSPTLKIPHPLLHQRKFNLIPLNDIIPDFIHPVLNKSISELLNLCEDKSLVAVFQKDKR